MTMYDGMERCAHCGGRNGPFVDVNLTSKGQIVGSIVVHQWCFAAWEQNRKPTQSHDAGLNGTRNPQVGIPFMITAAMRQALGDLGYSDEQIFAMSPAQAYEILDPPPPVNDGANAGHGNGARPPPPRDVNDVLRKGGPAAVRGISDGAKPPEPPPGDRKRKKPHNVPWPDLGSGGKPSRTCANARKAIEALGIECSYDVFHDHKLVSGQAIERWAGELSDHACQMLRVIIKEWFGFDPGREHTHDAAVQLCLRRQFDPVCDYLDGLQWDKRKRLDAWMVTYLDAENTELTRAIGRLALVAAVRRARQPGYKFDQIIVLEGPEGTGKSTAIEILAGKENFSDQTILGLDDRQQQEAMRGVWLYEIADLAGMSKADVDKTKAFSSRLFDRARPAYGRARVELPRRCVFFATTNNDTYLKSQTGNRRFWPVKTGRINLKALHRDRDMLWAEAAQIEAAGELLKLPETLWAAAAIEQERRRDHDPWDEILAANVKGVICDTTDGTGREERVSTADVLKLYLNLPADKITDSAAKRLSFCMARLGWQKPPDPIHIPGKGTARGYRRKLARNRKGTNL